MGKFREERGGIVYPENLPPVVHRCDRSMRSGGVHGGEAGDLRGKAQSFRTSLPLQRGWTVLEGSGEPERGPAGEGRGQICTIERRGWGGLFPRVQVKRVDSDRDDGMTGWRDA